MEHERSGKPLGLERLAKKFAGILGSCCEVDVRTKNPGIILREGGWERLNKWWDEWERDREEESRRDAKGP